MADLAADMRRAYELRGDTYSSMEVFGLLSRGAAEIERQRTVLRAYERWEADLIESGASWVNGLPCMTQTLYDRFIEIQDMRNAALGATTGDRRNG